jgi:hypothetical protein
MRGPVKITTRRPTLYETADSAGRIARVPMSFGSSPPNWPAGMAIRLLEGAERRPLDVSRAKPDGPNLPATSRLSAFLNIPYDDAFQHLYLAYIAGFAAKGLTPRATLDQASTQAWRDP